jgi:hypothetical protein
VLVMKLVIRHLPPDLPEPVFWSTVDPLLPLDHATTSFRRYDAGRLRKECVCLQRAERRAQAARAQSRQGEQR